MAACAAGTTAGPGRGGTGRARSGPGSGSSPRRTSIRELEPREDPGEAQTVAGARTRGPGLPRTLVVGPVARGPGEITTYDLV